MKIFHFLIPIDNLFKIIVMSRHISRLFWFHFIILQTVYFHFLIEFVQFSETKVVILTTASKFYSDRREKYTIVNQICHSLNGGDHLKLLLWSLNEFYLHGQSSSNANDNSSLVKVNSNKERSFSDIHMISCIHNLCRIQMTDLNM